MPKYKVGLIGWGMSAKTFHLPFVLASEGLSLVAMVSSQQQACAKLHPQVRCVEHVDDLIAQGGIDVAIVTTPNHLHYEQSLALLRAGIHVVVDKPATLTAEHISELFEVAAEHNVWLAVFHNRRWDGDFMALQEAVQQGLYGTAKVFINQFDRFRPLPRLRWRESDMDGAGIWYDLGPHIVDQALCLFGRPDALSANLRQLRQQSKNIDYFQVCLHYPDREVVLRSSPFCTDPMLRFQLETDRGTWRKYGLDPQEALLKTGVIPGSQAWFACLPKEHAHWCDESSETRQSLPVGNYAVFYQAVEQALAGEGQRALPVTPQQAIDVAMVIDAAIISSSKGARLAIAWPHSNTDVR
jgi:scyllo-inositol 2-dehydrogenase (NADP+)